MKPLSIGWSYNSIPENIIFWKASGKDKSVQAKTIHLNSYFQTDDYDYQFTKNI
jgi:hypothetical protein